MTKGRDELSREPNRIRMRKYRREWGERGLCSSCGREIIDKHYLTCEKCRRDKRRKDGNKQNNL